ncbi:MAG: tRNA uridine-5-carboxymethylaminomethyl(34) synthesis GTPase MnmE [Vampirovibrio sp.]
MLHGSLPLTQDAPTIVAQATASGPAGVAVLRLSGTEAWRIARMLFQGTALQKNRIAYGHIVDPQSGTLVDEVILLPFQAPHSFTGEDVIEIQCHGGQVLPQRILQLCLAQGATLASKGEFTRRAFLNGKVNLAQAEAIVDAIHAEGQALAQVAIQSLHANTLGQRLGRLRQVLIDVQADVVASMDYPEEVEEPDRARLNQKLDALAEEARTYTDQSQRYELLRHGLKVALLGQPNAGKSSLFNALLSQERSIVTPLAGTTRDVVTERLVVAGVPITLVDTAGLRESTDLVEQMGVARSQQACQEADAVLYVVDVTALDASPHFTLPAADTELLSQVPSHTPICCLLNKVDTLSREAQISLNLYYPESLCVSALSGVGLLALLAWLEERVHAGLGQTTRQEAELCLNQRQLDGLQEMTTHIEVAQSTLLSKGMPLDMVTIPITDALRALDDLLGIDTSELVLDEVFSRFCVGK